MGIEKREIKRGGREKGKNDGTIKKILRMKGAEKRSIESHISSTHDGIRLRARDDDSANPDHNDGCTVILSWRVYTALYYMRWMLQHLYYTRTEHALSVTIPKPDSTKVMKSLLLSFNCLG